MIGESKANFALDLSNEGITLWHRASGGTWESLGQVSLDSADFTGQVMGLRDSVGGGKSARTRRAIVRIPRSEVMLSKVRLGVFEDEAAVRHAQKQISELTPYSLEEICYDLGDKGVGNMAPVGIVARQTLIEAEQFARSNGFEPVYYTTHYAQKEFPREPRFFLEHQEPAAKPLWFVPWVAAASVGLTIGYFGYSYFSSQEPDLTLPVAQVEQVKPAEASQKIAVAEPVKKPEPEVETLKEPVVDATQLGLDDIAPNLPPVVTVLNAPDVTNYPEMVTANVARTLATATPDVTRLQPEKADPPTLVVSSKQLKTNTLKISEARRDLPDVGINDDIVALFQKEMALTGLAPPQAVEPTRLAALTSPKQAFNPVLLAHSLSDRDTDQSVPAGTTNTAERPPAPVSLVTAAPGTLTPTPEGTLGPENILIYAGPPPQKPRERPVVEPPVDALAGFKPRLRPEGLTPQTEPVVAAVEAPEEPVSILALADPTLRPFKPRNRPSGLVPEAVVAPVVEEPTLLALADPALKPFKPRVRPEGLAPVVEEPAAQTPQTDAIAVAIAADTAVQEATSLLSQADPALRGARARLRPATLVPAVDPVTAAIVSDTIAADIEKQQESAILLALADPTLRAKRARNRPQDLRTQVPAAPVGLLALADPRLAGKKAKARPSRLRIIKKPEPAVVAAVEEPEETGPTNTIASASRFAIASSPKPKARPAKLARIAKRVLQEDTSGVTKTSRSTTPKAAIGSTKPSPGPTSTTVANAATERSKFRKSRMSLVGIFGSPSTRRALVRLSSGKYVKVKKGDKVRGWQISAIGESSLRIKKGSRDQVLRIP